MFAQLLQQPHGHQATLAAPIGIEAVGKQITVKNLQQFVNRKLQSFLPGLAGRAPALQCLRQAKMYLTAHIRRYRARHGQGIPIRGFRKIPLTRPIT